MITSRWLSQPRPAVDEIIPIAAWSANAPAAIARSMKWRCPMKLIFSIPGVPSATPAHENSASIGPPHSSNAASMLARSARFTWMPLTPASVTSAKSSTTTSPPRSRTSSAVAAPMPVAPPTTTARFPSKR